VRGLLDLPSATAPVGEDATAEAAPEVAETETAAAS